MSEVQRVELQLLGQTIVLRSAEPREYLRSLVVYLEERVAELKRSGVKDPTAALALAALDITDELFRARADQGRDEGHLGERLSALASLLDQTMLEQRHSP